MAGATAKGVKKETVRAVNNNKKNIKKGLSSVFVFKNESLHISY